MSDLSDLNHAYDQQCHAVRSRIEQFARAYWENMPNYRDSAVDLMVEAIVPRVIAGQQTMARLTNAYLKACSARLGLDDPVGLPDTDVFEKGLRGVDPRVVYRRPATTVYTKLARGKDFDSAESSGKLRLLNLIGTDLQMARTHTAHRTMSQWGGGSGGQRYYRRTLTGRENCALCVVASTQHYKVSKVMPIHPGCDCGFEPLPPGVGKEWVIDPDTLEQAHQAVQALGFEADRNARNPDYRKIIIERRHGEIGPIIALDRSQRFEGIRIGERHGVYPRIDVPSWYGFGRKNPRTDAQLKRIVSEVRKVLDDLQAFPPGMEYPRVKHDSELDRMKAVGRVRGLFDETTREISLNPDLKSPIFTLYHEHGHAIDFFLGNGRFATEIEGTFPWRIAEELLKTPSGSVLPEYGPYYKQNKEVFARAFAQYVVIKSGDKDFSKKVFEFANRAPVQWKEAEFDPFIDIFDQLILEFKHEHKKGHLH